MSFLRLEIQFFELLLEISVLPQAHAEMKYAAIILYPKLIFCQSIAVALDLDSKMETAIGFAKNAAQEDGRTESSLYALPMVMYAKGELSGAQAGQEDINKTHDGLNVVGLDRIARLQQCRNLARTLAAMMPKASDLPMQMEVHIPMKGLEDGVPCASLLLPHEMFRILFPESWGVAKLFLA